MFLSFNTDDSKEKKPVVFHVFLFSVYYVLFFQSNHLGFYSPEAVILTLLATVTIAAIMWYLTTFLFRNSVKAGILVTLVTVLFFTHVHLYLAVKKLIERYFISYRSSPSYVLFVFYITVFLLCSYILFKTRRKLYAFTKILNIVAFVMTALVIVNIGWTFSTAKSVHADLLKSSSVMHLIDTAEIKEPLQLPDIYYIIIDSYARHDVIENEFGFDNSSFLDFLDTKGFYIANKSTTNYNITTASLASSLNFRYLDDLNQRMGKNSKNRMPLIYLARFNRMFSVLKHYGYDIVSFSQGSVYWGQDNRDADLFLVENYFLNRLHESISFFRYAIFRTTALLPVRSYILSRFKYDIDFFAHFDGEATRKKIWYIFKMLPEISDIKSPRFVYVHLQGGHMPLLFSNENRQSNYNDYANNIIYYNSKVKEVVNEILVQSIRPSVIIIQGDHGLGSVILGKEEASIKIQFPILNAIYMGGKGDNLLYETITPVNTFRVILKEYFGLDIDIVEDRNYMIEDWSFPYNQDEVTERLKTMR